MRALDQEIRSRGRGSIRAVERAAGHGEGWWQHRVESGNITIHQLLEVLEHLGLDAVGFVRRALGAEGALELDRPRGKPPEIIGKAWDRARSGVEGSGVGAPFLDTLDQQRYRDPGEVVKLALWAVDHVELDLLPRLLGVTGSAWRLMILLDEATHAIHAGIEIAQERGDQPAVGNLLQRLSYVVADRGDRAEALRLAERAAMINLRSGDQFALGKALVAQGIWLYYLGRSEEAIETQKSALDQLQPGPSRPRCAAFQCMGGAQQQLGNLDAALENVIAAQEAAVGNEDWAKAKLLWLRARIHGDLEELDQAASLLGEVVAMFRELHYGETALATCELVRIQLLLGRPADSYRTATSMRALLDPLHHNQIISAAIADLLRSGRAGLTLGLIERVMARIEVERQRNQVWRSLRVKPAE